VTAGTCERMVLSRSIPNSASASSDTAQRRPSSTSATTSIYGLSRSRSNHSATCSRSTEGAKGRKLSRNFTLRLSCRCMLGERGSERTAGVPGRRLNPNILDRPVVQDLAVGDAVQRDTAGEAKPAHAGFRDKAADQAQDHLLGNRLDRCSEIHMPLFQTCLRRTRRSSEEITERAVCHPQPDAVIEILLVEVKRSVCLEIDKVLEDGMSVSGLTIRRQA